MITALYEWAKYNIKKDGIDVEPQKFNLVMENICFGKWSEKDLQILYEPIQDLFEIDPEADPAYRFSIIEDNRERQCTQKEMKYIMLRKMDLSGKAQRSIGGTQLPKYLNSGVNAIKGKSEMQTIQIQTKSGKKRFQKVRKYLIPKSGFKDLWRYRLLDTYLVGNQQERRSPRKSATKLFCPLCGFIHNLENLRVELPINLYVVNITNYTSYMTGKPSHSLCPYCAMLFMRTLAKENAPQKIYFRETRKAYLYILPFDPESEVPYKIFSRRTAEDLMKKEFDKKNWEFKEIYALDYVLMLPILVCAYLPRSTEGKIKPTIYMAFADASGGTETITDQIVVTRLDFLAKVGEELKSGDWLRTIRNFKQRLDFFVKEFKDLQKINGYKLIFRFLSRILTEGKTDFTFLHRILRKEISKKEGPKLQGYFYINAFLKGGSMAKAKTINIIAEEIVEAGRRFGNAWAELKERKVKEGTSEKWFNNMVMKLDSPTTDGFHVIFRKMVREMAQEDLRWGIKKEILGFLSDKTRVSWRHAFLTGVYFGYYGYFKKEKGDSHD
ncbi:MAG: hypothetical protein B5M53_07615 [Candidatus Cloacimonas sp. 4484_209]|nr:MAG: hypothetical protein B5M53_07615 [Candidatus Cloacimonas sp. 4484_209]